MEKEESVNEWRESGDDGDMDKQNSETEKPVESELTVEKGENGSELISSAPPIEESEGEAVSLNGDDDKEPAAEDSDATIKQEQKIAKIPTRKMSTSSNKSTRSDNGAKNGDTSKVNGTKDKTMSTEEKKVPVSANQSQQLVSTLTSRNSSTPTPSSSTRSTRSQNPEFLARQRNFLHKIHLASNHLIVDDDLLMDDDDNNFKINNKFSGNVGTAQTDENNSVDGLPAKRKRERSASNGTLSPRIPSPSVTNMLGGSASANNSGSSSPAASQMQPATKKRRSTRTDSTGSQQQMSASPMTEATADRFCWGCHKDGIVIKCETCPRVFHLRCVQLENAPTEDWVCPECMTILHAENVDTRSRAMQLLSLDQLCNLLKYAVSRMKMYSGAEPFWKAVDLMEFPQYREYVAHPMDLSLLERNIKKRLYGSTEAFVADTKWMLHNCIIFNSYQSRLTAIAKMLVKICKQEMAEIENCPDCYLNAHIRKDSWFIEVCRRPHVLVWAKLKGFPFWPAKVMRTNKEGMVDVRFFGAHDRAWVPVRECFLYSKAIPASARNKKRNNLEACIQEVEQHTKKLREKYGTFQHASFRTHFEPGREPEQLRMLLPYYNPDDDGGPPSTKRNKMYGVSYSFRTYQRSNHAEKEERNKNYWRSRTSENDESMEGFKFTDSKSKSEKKKVWESENLEDDNFKRTSRSRKRTISGSRVSRPSSVSSDDSEASDLALQQDKKNDSAKSASLIEWSKFEESAAQLTVGVEGIISDEDKLSVTSDDRKLRDGEDSRDIVLPTASIKLTEGETEDKTAIETTPKSSEVVKKAFTGLSIVDKLQEKLLRLERSNVSDDAVSCANVTDDDKPQKTEEGSRNSEDCSTQKSSTGSSNDKQSVIERTSNSKRLQDSITDDECRNEERERSESPIVNRGPSRSEPKCYGKQLLPKVVLYNVAFSKNMVLQKGLNSNEQICSNEKFVEAAEKEIMEERVCKSSLMSETTSRLENLLKNRFEETECHMTDSSGESESSSCPDNDIKLTEKDNEDDKDTETKSTSSESTSDSGEGSVEMDALKRTPEHGYSRFDDKETILGENGKCDVPNKIASKSNEEMQMEEEKEANVNDSCMESAKDCSKELEESNKNAPDDCNKTDVVSEPQSKEVTADESPPDKEAECDAEKNGFEPSHESDRQSLILVPTETEPISEPNRQNSEPISELETHSSNPVSELGKQSSEFVSESGGKSSVSVSESEKQSSDPLLESENQSSDPVPEPEPEKLKFENVSEFEKQSSELPEKNAKKCAILDCESVVTGDYEEANKEAERKSDKDTSEESNQRIAEKKDKNINVEHSKEDDKSTEKSIKEENTVQDTNENLRKDIDKCDKGSIDTSVKNSAVKVYLAKTSKLLDKKIRELSEMSRTEAQLGNGVTITPADPLSIPSKKTKTTDDSVGKEIENTINPIRKIKEEPIDLDDVPTESSASSATLSSTSSSQSSAKSSPDGKQNTSVPVKKSVDVENSLKKEKVFNKKLLMDDKDRLSNNDSPASLSEKDGIFPSLFLDPSITITVINDKQGETVDVPTTNKRKICGSDINVNELRASVNLSKDISLTVVGAAYNGPAKDQPTSLDMECDHESDHEETQNSASSATSSSAVPLTVPNTVTGQNGNKQKKQKPAGGSETLQARSRARKSFPNRPILPNVKIKPHPELVNGIGTFNSKTSLMRRNSSGTNSNSSDSRRSSFGASPHELLMPGPQSGGETHGENSGTSDNNNHGSAMVVLPPILGNPPTSTTNHIQALRAVNGNIGAPDIRMMPGPHGQPHPGGSNSRISPAGQGPTSSGSSCMPPQLKPRPQGPLLSQHPPSLPAEAGPVSAEINRHKHKLCDFLSSTLEEMLRDLSSVGNAEATIKSLQLELEKLQWRHNQELAEMKHNTDLIVMEMRASMESDRQRAVAETIRQCEVDKQRAVEETKKKQWCTNCGKEALFYCCWNTSYCDYPCQQRHWPQHMSSCAQNSQSNEGGGRDGADGVQRKSPQTSANSAAHHKSNPSQQQQQQQQQHQHQQPWFDSVPMFNPTTSASMIYRGAYSSKTESPSPSVTEDDFDTNNNNYEGSQRDGSQEVDRKDIKLGDLIRMGVEIPKIQRKRKRCGKCAGCTTVGNCGQCPPCNSTRTHQVCRQRRCTNLQMETIVATTAKKVRINTQQKLQQMVSNGPSGGKPMGGPPPGYNPPVMSQQARGMGGPMGRVPPQYSGLVPVPRPGNVQGHHMLPTYAMYPGDPRGGGIAALQQQQRLMGPQFPPRHPHMGFTVRPPHYFL